MFLSKEKITIEFVKSDQNGWVDFVEGVLNFQPEENKDNDLSKEKINLEKNSKI